jgi:tripeptide aminopeptidase
MKQALAALAFGASFAAHAAEINIPDTVRQQFASMHGHAQVKKALDFIRQDEGRTLKEQIELTQIPAPPFKEAVRAAEFQKRLQALGFKDARIDKEGNVIAVRPGSGKGPKLVFSAHMDTVFPEGTDVTVKEKGGILYAPGIGDDTRGLAELLSVVRALNATGIKTVGDIWFVGTVGEEGLGDLRGVKALFRDNKDLDGFISVDGTRTSTVSFRSMAAPPSA